MVHSFSLFRPLLISSPGIPGPPYLHNQPFPHCHSAYHHHSLCFAAISLLWNVSSTSTDLGQCWAPDWHSVNAAERVTGLCLREGLEDVRQAEESGGQSWTGQGRRSAMWELCPLFPEGVSEGERRLRTQLGVTGDRVTPPEPQDGPGLTPASPQLAAVSVAQKCSQRLAPSEGATTTAWVFLAPPPSLAGDEKPSNRYTIGAS